MRFLGNKTKLLETIWGFAQDHGVRVSTMLDVFAGTASVGRFFRSKLWKVATNDVLASSYVRQRTYIALAEEPLSPHGSLVATIAALGASEGRYGLFSRQFSEGGPADRLYFSAENGARIDGIWVQLVRWLRDGELELDGFYALLTSLLEAADRVANISGIYGAYLKQLNANARKPLELRTPELDLRGPPGSVYRLPANELIRKVETGLIYVDPPYNGRQYVKYYHVPEILAELHLAEDLEAYEAGLYGKTGLRAFEDRLSSYCRRAEVVEAFLDLVTHAQSEHLIVSYNEEGILSREDIEAALSEAGRYDPAQDFAEVDYRRFRSDSEDRRNVGSASVNEWLFHCRPR